MVPLRVVVGDDEVNGLVAILHDSLAELSDRRVLLRSHLRNGQRERGAAERQGDQGAGVTGEHKRLLNGSAEGRPGGYRAEAVPVESAHGQQRFSGTA